MGGYRLSSEKVYEDNKVLAFKDINPAAPIHVLVIPKEHVQNVKSLCKLKEKFPPCVKISCLYDSENNLLNLKDSPLDRGKEVFLTMFNNRIIL